MALPELFANSPVPGTTTALATLTAEATATATTIKVSAAAPAKLQAAGQFRVLLGTELMLVTGGATGTTWTVVRGIEGSTAAIHAIGVEVINYITAEGLDERYPAKNSSGQIAASVVPSISFAALAASQPFPVELPENNGALGNGVFAYDGAITEKTKKLKCATTKPFTKAMAEEKRAINICGAASQRSSFTGFAAKTGENNTLAARIETYISAEEVEISVEAKTTVTGAFVMIASDDSVAIEEAIKKAVTKAQEEKTYYCEVWFQDKIYGIAGEIKSAQKGYARIQLPLIECTEAGTATQGSKVTIKFKGVGEPSALPLWYQKVPQRSGTVLYDFGVLEGSTLNILPEYSSSKGRPAMIGGPTPEQGYGDEHYAAFSNMHVVIEGITASAATNSTMTAFELNGLASAIVVSLGSYALGIPGFKATEDFTGVNAFLLPINGYENAFKTGYNEIPRPATALAMPTRGNNDKSIVWNHSVEGHTTGMEMGEHTHHGHLSIIYTLASIIIGSREPWFHGSTADYVSLEGFLYGIVAYAASSTKAAGVTLNIAMLDVEEGWTRGEREYDIVDEKNVLIGDVKINNLTWPPKVLGGGVLNVQSLKVYPGEGTQTKTVTSQPSVPATKTPLTNPYWRNCAVYIKGGTISAIKVNGVATGTTSGYVNVGSRNTIELEYTGTPEWKWFPY